MRRWLLALVVLTGCTPAQLAVINDVQAERGLRDLTAAEAVELWCTNTPEDRAAWLGAGGLEALVHAGGPLPDCAGHDVPEWTHPEGFIESEHGVWLPPVAYAIRRCESGGSYTAQNPRSSASGAYQFIDSSWSGYGHAARYGVSKAKYATPAQQDEAFLITWRQSGTTPWNASGHCW